MTADTGRFLAVTRDFLRVDPARNSVMLTVTENLRVNAAAQAPSAAPLFGWWQPSPAPVGAAFMHTPDFPVMLSHMSGQAAAELARDLAAAGRRVRGVNASQDAADAFAAAWRDRTGNAVAVHRRMRLFRLGEFVPPAPGTEGTARQAAGSDRDLLAGWFDAFTREVGDPPGQDHRGAVDERIGYGGLTVWEVGGIPVSIAGRTRAVAGMVRVGPVYTPPELRGRGYGGAATAAVSQAALDADVREVVLYTDLANPTSNALYQRLGYRPVEDRVVLSFDRRSGTAGSDDPGARAEEHAAPGVVLRQGGPQPLPGGPGRRGIQAGQQVLRVPQAEHQVVGHGRIRAVVDGLVHVGKADLGEAGRRQDAPGHGRVAERERIRAGPRSGASGPAMAWRIAVDHSLRSRPCQASITSRPPGRSAIAILLNAATGSAKNIVPNRLMHRSKCRGGNRWT